MIIDKNKVCRSEKILRNYRKMKKSFTGQESYIKYFSFVNETLNILRKNRYLTLNKGKYSKLSNSDLRELYYTVLYNLYVSDKETDIDALKSILEEKYNRSYSKQTVLRYRRDAINAFSCCF